MINCNMEAKMTPDWIRDMFGKPFSFSSLILYLGHVRTRATEMWAGTDFVCYTCVHCIYLGNAICLFCWSLGLL